MNEYISGKGSLFNDAELQVRLDIVNPEGLFVLIEPYHLALHQKMWSTAYLVVLKECPGLSLSSVDCDDPTQPRSVCRNHSNHC